jgi:hypothetical protein
MSGDGWYGQFSVEILINGRVATEGDAPSAQGAFDVAKYSLDGWITAGYSPIGKIIHQGPGDAVGEICEIWKDAGIVRARFSSPWRPKGWK